MRTVYVILAVSTALVGWMVYEFIATVGQSVGEALAR